MSAPSSSTPLSGPVQSLGYVGLRAKNLDDWFGYGARLIGLQVVDRSRATLALRMDDRRQGLIVNADGGEASAFSAGRWRTPPRSTGWGADLDSHGVSVAQGSRALADERHVADLIVLNEGVAGSNPAMATRKLL
jgi:hypothetical protein